MVDMKLHEAGAVPAAASLYLLLYFNQGFLDGLVCVQSASADLHPAKTPSALNLAETDNSHLTTPQRSRGRREAALTLSCIYEPSNVIRKRNCHLLQ